jgi:hypothetical protein
VALTVAASDALAVAVFERVPVADDRTVATTEYVTEPPAGMMSASEMFPEPEALKPVTPPDAVAVQVSELTAGLRVRGSVTDTPVAVDGPEFEAAIVYVIDVPGTAEPVECVTDEPPSLSVLVTARLAWELRVSVSVALTVGASVAEAAAVFTYVKPVAPEGTVPDSSRVTDCPEASDAKVQVSVAGVKVTPAGRLGLVTFVNPWAGRLSTTLRFAAFDGPAFETTIV